MNEHDELVILRAEKRQLADYAHELEEEIVRLKGIIAEREHGRERQYQPGPPVGAWRL